MRYSFWFAFFWAAVAPIQAASASVTIYYIPFTVDTYLPVTMDNIECRAFERWILELPEPDLKKRLALLPEKERTIDQQLIRIKVVFSDATLYIDKVGLATDGIGTYSVDVRSLMLLRKSVARLDDLTGGIGCAGR